MTREEIITGLKAGRTLVIDRRDAPEWPLLMEMEREGLVTSEFVQYDEQSSAMKYRWAVPAP